MGAICSSMYLPMGITEAIGAIGAMASSTARWTVVGSAPGSIVM